jgi:hypothetical protein
MLVLKRPHSVQCKAVYHPGAVTCHHSPVVVDLSVVSHIAVTEANLGFKSFAVSIFRHATFLIDDA